MISKGEFVAYSMVLSHYSNNFEQFLFTLYVICNKGAYNENGNSHQQRLFTLAYNGKDSGTDYSYCLVAAMVSIKT